MNTRPTSLPGRGRGLFARIALALGSSLALVVAAVLGAFVFVALLGLFVLVAAALWARIAWLRWRMRRTGRPVPAPASRTGGRSTSDSATLEGEYIVLSPDRDRPGG